MNIILGQPGSGKTKYLIKRSAENNIPILCESVQRQERLLVKALGYGYTIPTPIVYTQMENFPCKEVYIDDVERLLQTLFNCEVKEMSVNFIKKEEVVTL